MWNNLLEYIIQMVNKIAVFIHEKKSLCGIKNSQLNRVSSHINPVHIITFCIYKIYFCGKR